MATLTFALGSYITVLHLKHEQCNLALSHLLYSVTADGNETLIYNHNSCYKT